MFKFQKGDRVGVNFSATSEMIGREGEVVEVEDSQVRVMFDGYVPRGFINPHYFHQDYLTQFANSRFDYSTRKLPGFFMLFVTGGDSPTFRHTSWESAKDEAERLAKETGKEVYILKKAARCVPNTEVTITWEMD